MVHAKYRRPDRFPAAVICLAVVAAAISVLSAFWPEPASPRFDEMYYHRLGDAIAGGSYDDGYMVRPPLYPLFLALVFRIFGPGLTPALIIQGLLRGLVVAGVALMGRKYVSKTAGLAGTAILVIYPDFIHTYTRLMTEAVYIPLFLLSFHLLQKAVRTGSITDGIKAGVGCGAASLARSTSVFFTLLVAAWLVITASGSGRLSRRKAACAGAMLLLLLATISPWTIRNLVTHGGFIAVSNDSAFNLSLMTSGKGFAEFTKEWEAWGTQVERQREGYRRWMSHLRDDPGFHARRFLAGLPRLLFPRRGARLPSAVAEPSTHETRAARIHRTVLEVLEPVAHLLLLVGGLVGVVAVERSTTRRNLLLLAFGYFLIAHGATLARLRFMVPLNVLLAIYAGGLVARLVSLGRTRAA